MLEIGDTVLMNECRISQCAVYICRIHPPIKEQPFLYAFLISGHFYVLIFLALLTIIVVGYLLLFCYLVMCYMFF